MDKTDKIFLAGHKGMVGSAILRHLTANGFTNIITKSRAELDLLNENSVKEFFEANKPDYVILAAAKVGGIKANMEKPAEFLYENLTIQNNIINQSFKNGVKKFVFLGSSCIYPKECEQPMKEEYLLTGKLEPTNEGYALAKIAGLKFLKYLNEEYGFKSISLMPCNLYGTNDSFDPAHSHVLSSLVRRFVDAVDEGTDSVEIWGTGIARREFMHVDDMADAVLYFTENYESPEFINIGWGTDVSIKELATIVATECGYTGRLIWDETKPNGMLRKCMDVTNMKLANFEPKITLLEGVKKTISEYKEIKLNKKKGI
nr:GDP-L-fucose synthase [uncultured Pedobacter sp.]